MVTKNDTYAALIELGIYLGFTVIPEFRVDVKTTCKDSTPKKTHKKSIDLVWVKRKRGLLGFQDRASLKFWTAYATFEIEGCNVSIGKEFRRHLDDLPKIKNLDSSRQISHFVALYTSAFDRSQLNRKRAENDIEIRRQEGTPCNIHVFSVAEDNWMQQVRKVLRTCAQQK